MATKTEPDYPSSPPNDESEGDDQEQESIEEEQEERKPIVHNSVADLLKRLQSSGALIKKPKQEYHCFTCDEDFPDWEELENHLIQHVQLPAVVLDKLPSDDEDVPGSEGEWSDEEETPAPQTGPKGTPQRIDISKILNKTGLSIKRPSEQSNLTSSPLDKLSGLGFTIKKSNTPIKEEPEEKSNDIMQKLGKLGGIKLKLKSDGSSMNSFKVVNGLKDFKASDDEDDDEGDVDKSKNQGEESDEDQDKSGEQEKSGDEEDSGDEPALPVNRKITLKGADTLQSLKGMTVTKTEPTGPTPKPAPVPRLVSKEGQPVKPPSRPLIKQTPKRGTNVPAVPSRDLPQTSAPSSISSNSSPERPQSQESSTGSVVVKKEIESNDPQPASTEPLFSGQIKTERSSPPPTSVTSTPIISSIKSEPVTAASNQSAQPLFSNQAVPVTPTSSAPPLLPVTKVEDTGVTIIEINGDSNDEDDDYCVVSATPASDVKPIIPKSEPLQATYPPPVYPASSQPSFPSPIPQRESTAKQHNFNWNAPDSKPAIDMLEKSADDMFKSLLSSKKDSNSLSDAEYISLDTLGPQHSCDVCNTRFTDIGLLENHIRMTGHTRSMVMSPSSSSLMPYNPAASSSSSSNILQSLLPVKHMVEQVGKLSGMGGAPGFTHQQNVMINIQAYPGAGGMPPPQSPYNPYASPNMQQGYTQSHNMYSPGGQQMPGQYPNQNFMGQQNYGQFQQPMPKPGYPGTMPPNSFDSSPYSTASPLHGMQQAIYGQTPTSVSSQMGQMGPPPAPPPNNQYHQPSSPGAPMKLQPNGSAIKIQNIQTFPPSNMAGPSGSPGGPDASSAAQGMQGQQMMGQPSAPGQIRLAVGANVGGPRARMPGVRGPRPTIRPGVHVQGQIRGAKPRMPMKRPMNPGASPMMKKRPNILLPGKHDNEDCQVMAMQKQREGLPLIQSVQGAKDKLNLGSQISITKKTVNREANAMANVLASRGISIKQKAKSRSPSPERPVPHIPNLGAGVSIKHTSKSSNFSIPEAKVGSGMISCKICKKMFMNQNSLAVHMSNAHPQSKLPMFKCEECPASYPKILQLQHHKRVFHNVMGPNRELGLPVIDISLEENLKKLNNLGIYSYIPLAGREGAAGCFGIPIISVHNSHNGIASGLQALGADGLLSLGPMKSLPNT